MFPCLVFTVMQIYVIHLCMVYVFVYDSCATYIKMGSPRAGVTGESNIGSLEEEEMVFSPESSLQPQVIPF